jgi:hypothetical protein
VPVPPGTGEVPTEPLTPPLTEGAVALEPVAPPLTEGAVALEPVAPPLTDDEVSVEPDVLPPTEGIDGIAVGSLPPGVTVVPGGQSPWLGEVPDVDGAEDWARTAGTRPTATLSPRAMTRIRKIMHLPLARGIAGG